jgi:hypothetical protein
MAKTNRKQALELAVGGHPGTADSFPMGGATLR